MSIAHGYRNLNDPITAHDARGSGAEPQPPNLCPVLHRSLRKIKQMAFIPVNKACAGLSVRLKREGKPIVFCSRLVKDIEMHRKTRFPKNYGYVLRHFYILLRHEIISPSGAHYPMATWRKPDDSIL